MSLVGINSDGAVYYSSGDDWVWIPDQSAFAALGFNYADIDWEDVLPSPSSNPYQASDNPSGNPPDQGESGATPPDGGAPPAASTPATVTLPLWVGLSGPGGPGSAGSPIYLLQNGAYHYVPDAATFAALGGSLSLVTWEDALPAPQGADLGSQQAPTVTVPIEPTPPDAQLEPITYGLFQPSGNYGGVSLTGSYQGRTTAQGSWSTLVYAFANEVTAGALTAQAIASSMGAAVA